jgi:hypothetical protein
VEAVYVNSEKVATLSLITSFLALLVAVISPNQFFSKMCSQKKTQLALSDNP